MTIDTPAFYPKRLSEARVAAGLTMTALGARVHLSAQAISAYENGARRPTADALSQLAFGLGVNVAYFKEERPFPVVADSAVFFRSVSSARTRRNQEMRKQQATWAYEVSAWLDRYVALPKFSNAVFWESDADDGFAVPQDHTEESTDSDDGFAAPQDHTEESIEEAAAKLRVAWGMGCGPIPDMVALLESHGIRVIRQASGSTKLDAFSRIINAQPMIFLSSDKGAGPRSRFDAAHELGHLLLHSHLPTDEVSSPQVIKRIESEANLFAGAFLMPESSFSREIHGTTLGSFLAMKRRWKLSAQAIIRRSFNLGAIDEFQFHRLCVDISARGMRTKEPYDEEILPEDPSVIRRAWELLVEHRVISRQQIVDDLQLPQEFISATLGVPLGNFESENIIYLDLRKSVCSDETLR